MCIYGNITKKEIKEEKKKNPEKFIETSQSLKLENPRCTVQKASWFI